MTAASMAPLCALALHGAALAQQTDTISTSTTTPINTATAVSGGPGNIDVAAGGSVNPTSAGPAVTLNSNNTVSVEGSIGMNNVNNGVGIEETGNNTGAINVSGTISIGESFSAASNKDGYTYSGRYGIWTQGNLNGGVNLTGSVSVQGNNSYGVYIGNGLSGGASNGVLGLGGGVSLTGDSGAAVYTAGEVGAVQVTNTVTAKGQYSVGLQTTGTIDGALNVFSTISSTGYASTTRPTTSTLLNEVEGQPGQIEQGGSALVVQGSVAGGIFLGAPPQGTTSNSTTVVDGNTLGEEAASEGTAVIETFGVAPAMVIGGTSPITIGEYGSANANGFGPGDNNFGLIVEGDILASGVYDNFSALGLDIGNGNGGVTISGGIRIANTGVITATSYGSNATAVLLESGASTPLIQNEGTITATIAASSNPVSANAVLIQSGASVPSFVNIGTVSANVTGDSASAYAIVDKSGTITNFTNQGQISASIAATKAGDTTTGSTIALDLSANTSGVTFNQNVGGEDGLTEAITGDVLLSQTGTNTVNISAGYIDGALSLGKGSGGQLNISNGAVYDGALTFTGTGLAVNLSTGAVLQDNSPTIINGSSLTIDGTSKLVFAIDPQYSAQTGVTNTQFNVATAKIASGATIGANFLSAPKGVQTFTIVQATSLTAGSTTLATISPYLFNTTAQANAAAGTVTLTVQPKTAAQLGLNKAEAAAYPAIYASLGQDSGIQSALTNAPTQSSFLSAYQQMLPDSAGDVFQVVTSMSKAVARASVGAAGFDGSGAVGVKGTTDDADDEEDDIGSQGGLWASEYLIGINQDRADNEAYRAVGLGLVGGLDFDGYGADISFASANVVKPHDPGDSIVSISRVETGLYATPQFGILHTEARLAAGYLKISDRREFAASETSGDQSTVSTVSRTANGSWNGYDLSGRLGASAPFDLTRHIFMMPEAHVDVFDVSEGRYSEGGGGQGYDLDVSARNSTESSVTAGFVTGLHYGTTFVFKPQLELAWDDVLTGGPGATTARFAYGGPNFTVPANSVSGGAGVIRLKLDGDGEYVHFAVEAGGEFRSDYQNADIRAVFRISY
jgi:hypothetical protein